MKVTVIVLGTPPSRLTACISLSFLNSSPQNTCVPVHIDFQHQKRKYVCIQLLPFSSFTPFLDVSRERMCSYSGISIVNSCCLQSAP